MISFVLPWPPTVNNLTAVVRGRKINSQKARQYKAECAIIIGQNKPIDGPVELLIELYPPDRRARDASNHIKAAEDCLTAGNVWHDDSQVKRLIVIMNDSGSPMKGSCRVTVSPL